MTKCNEWYQVVGELPGEPPSRCALRKGHNGRHDQFEELECGCFVRAGEECRHDDISMTDVMDAPAPAPATSAEPEKS